MSWWQSRRRWCWIWKDKLKGNGVMQTNESEGLGQTHADLQVGNHVIGATLQVNPPDGHVLPSGSVSSQVHCHQVVQTPAWNTRCDFSVKTTHTNHLTLLKCYFWVSAPLSLNALTSRTYPISFLYYYLPSTRNPRCLSKTLNSAFLNITSQWIRKRGCKVSNW